MRRRRLRKDGTHLEITAFINLIVVLVPFLLIHAFLQARASEIVDSLEAAKITFLNLVQRLAGEQLSTREQRAT